MNVSPDVPPATSQAQRSATILLIDDDDLVRRAAACLLTDCGYHVLAADGGAQALDIVRRVADIDLVLMDVLMPEMSAERLLHELRELVPETKVLITSGMSNDARINALLSQGAIGFIRKPFRLNELARKLEHAMGMLESM